MMTMIVTILTLVASVVNLKVISGDDSTIPICSNEMSVLDYQEQPCYTFNELINNSSGQNLFRSNTNVLVFPGNHSIVTMNTSLVIENIVNFTIMGITRKANDNSVVLISRVTVFCTGLFGITFQNITNLKLSDISFVGCGVQTLVNLNLYRLVDYRRIYVTLYVKNSYNVTMENIAITNSKEIGLLLHNVHKNVTISHSLFTKNHINCLIQINTNALDCANISIAKSNFTFGHNDTLSLASGITLLTLSLSTIETEMFLTLLDVLLLNNFASLGNFYVQSPHNIQFDTVVYANFQGMISMYSREFHFHSERGLYLNARSSIVVISNSYFKNSCAYVSCKSFTLNASTIEECPASSLRIHDTSVILEDVTIAYSKKYTIEILLLQSSLMFRGVNSFINNTGVFYAEQNAYVIFDTNSTTLFKDNNIKCTTVVTCRHQLQGDLVCSTFYGSEINIEILDNSSISFKNNTAQKSGGITLFNSNIKIRGYSSLLFEDNRGNRGGGMELSSSSITYGTEEVSNSLLSIILIRNVAVEKGGAIYMHRDYMCPFQALIRWNFINNTALIAGSAIYSNVQPLNSFDNVNVWCNANHFDRNHFQGTEGDLSVIASDPTRVCMCVDSVPNCNITNYTAELFPGQMFEMEAVAVGLQYGTVPSVVQAEFNNAEFSWRHIRGGQYLQTVDNICTHISFETYLSSMQMRVMTLTVNRLKSNSASKDNDLHFRDFIVNFLIKNCSLGFTLNTTLHRCTCQKVLMKHEIQCDLNTLIKIVRPSPKWITATFMHTAKINEPGVIVHDHCPFDYCISDKELHLDLRYPDKQCAFNRSGVLCGECQTNFSQVFGSFRCKQCSSLWFLLLPLFAFTGVALVVLLMILNLTVAVGTINGLIFYANIVRANHAIFFPPQTTNSFLSWFIAWLNLDLGIETCFYDGLDAYAKTWLQFSFPFYIWFIVISIIVLCRYSTTLARLCEKNAVQVLATLFLLSYTKLLRLVITILQPATLVYPDGFYKRVWLYDGNVEYLKGKHIPLFMAALLLLMLLSIPYTITLLTIQWLQKFNHYRLLFWVGRVKPLLEAHTGPCKDNHRYWVGLLLLVRIGLFLVFSLNITNNPSVNLLTINIAMFIICIYLYLAGGVYKSKLVNIIEISLFLNIGVLSAATLYELNTSSDQASITHSLVGVAFITFIAITLYHVFLRIVSTNRGAEVKGKFEDKIKQKVNQRLFESTPSQCQVSHSSIDLRESLLADVNKID